MFAKINVNKKENEAKSKRKKSRGAPRSVPKTLILAEGEVSRIKIESGTRLAKNKYKKGKNFLCARIQLDYQNWKFGTTPGLDIF